MLPDVDVDVAVDVNVDGDVDVNVNRQPAVEVGNGKVLGRRLARFGVCHAPMTGEHLEAILKTAGAKHEKDGWSALPEGTTMTLHVAHDGAGMTVPRVEAVRQEGELVFARNSKRELFALVRTDVFAIALEGDASAGKVVRRAGFG